MKNVININQIQFFKIMNINENQLKRAYEIGLMLKKDFPEYKKSLFEYNITKTNLVRRFKCRVSYGLIPIRDDKKLELYSSQYKVLALGFDFYLHGFCPSEYKKYISSINLGKISNLNSYDGVLNEDEEEKLNEIRRNKFAKGLQELDRNKLAEYGRKAIEKRKNLIMKENIKEIFFKYCENGDFLLNDGEPNLVKISEEMGIKLQNLRTFYHRHKKVNGEKITNYISWKEPIETLKGKKTLRETLEFLLNDSENWKVRNGQEIPNYQRLSEDLFIYTGIRINDKRVRAYYNIYLRDKEKIVKPQKNYVTENLEKRLFQ